MHGNAYILAITKHATDCPFTFSGEFTKEAAEAAKSALEKAGEGRSDMRNSMILVLDTGRPHSGML